METSGRNKIPGELSEQFRGAAFGGKSFMSHIEHVGVNILFTGVGGQPVETLIER